MSEFYVSPLAGHSHEKRILFRILAQFLWPMVNKEVDQFITYCAHYQLVNLCSHEAHQMLHTIRPDNPFEVEFLEFW